MHSISFLCVCVCMHAHARMCMHVCFGTRHEFNYKQVLISPSDRSPEARRHGAKEYYQLAGCSGILWVIPQGLAR